MKRIISIVSTLVLGLNMGSAQSVYRQSFNDDWQFALYQSKDEAKNSSPSMRARTLNLPHDWAIEGDFSKDNPSGTGGGALPGGLGIYTKTFTLTKEDKGKAVRIDFDGVYMDAEVIVNGHSLGTRPYGYISFGYDITPYLIYKGQNTVTVKVDNTEQPNSRWYSGCGIYRNVWLTKQPVIHVATNGTYVTTPTITKDNAKVNAEITIVNKKGKAVTVRNAIIDAKGNEVAANTQQTKAGSINAQLNVAKPHLWDINDPYLYTLLTTITDDKGNQLDQYTTTFGIRTFEFNDKQGFVLNGRKVTINGVCNHHDLGCLGAAVNKRGLERQLQLLKDMGCNGIRTSHNPPAPELLDLCDRMGFIVMDESFDMWRKKKTSHDYARYFNEWHERDLKDFIVRDRNHPSIFIWSIGNEVLEQWSDANADTLSLEEANMILNFGHSADMLAKEDGQMSVNSLLTKKLADFVRNIDNTRPITSGCNEPSPGNHLFRSGALDIIGFNYHNQNIPDVPKNFPGKPFIITESNSALQTRGYYRMPSDSMYIWPVRWDIPFADESFSCSSYENCHVPWGNTHEENILLHNKYPWISGQYIWTGFDYIGEPTPYGWPARSSYFGIIDLAGFPKDVYYLYQSEWTNKDVLHLFPHWNWKEGQTVDMWCYYNNADEVELFVNGVSQGVRAKNDSLLHTVWRVKYEPGEVTVVARKNGVEMRQQTIRTAGTPAAIRLTPDRQMIKADGTDLCYVTVEVVDKDGNICPWAENDIKFTVAGTASLDGNASIVGNASFDGTASLDGNTSIAGTATIAGVDNGSPISLERFKADHRKAFYGKCLVVVQSGKHPGKCTVTATAPGLSSSNTVITLQ